MLRRTVALTALSVLFLVACAGPREEMSGYGGSPRDQVRQTTRKRSNDTETDRSVMSCKAIERPAGANTNLTLRYTMAGFVNGRVLTLCEVFFEGHSAVGYAVFKPETKGVGSVCSMAMAMAGDPFGIWTFTLDHIGAPVVATYIGDATAATTRIVELPCEWQQE